MICEGWEGLTVDGRFPLLEWLGGWADRCVFLTVRQSTHTANIKLIQASGFDADAHVARWEGAKTLPHPCLVEMMETGRYRLNDTDVAYVVTEKAETFLSAIVPRKALDPAKVAEILLPVVDALAFVHENGFVHGSVKPSSIALIDDEWKLSSDEMGRAGEPLKLNRELDTYDAPELGSGTFTPAADMWSLGMIIVEACSQRTPVWNRDVPGVIGKVGTILGEESINIADFSLGRRSGEQTSDQPREAIAVVHVDGAVPDVVLTRLRGIPAVQRAKGVRLF